MTSLIDAEDADFAWMLDEGAAGHRLGLRLPVEGVDHPAILRYLRRVTAELRAGYGIGSWLVVESGTVVGLCGYKHCPNPAGAVEIGYGIAAAWRGRGIATRAVAALLHQSAESERIRELTAETARGNVASERVLERNGFTRLGTREDWAEGPLVRWSRPMGVLPSRPQP